MSSHNQRYTQHNRVKLVTGGKEYFALLDQLIRQAKHSIFLQVYIFDEDETGVAIAEALMHAAKNKAAVYVLVDGYASSGLSAGFQQQLLDAGIHFRMFKPLLKTASFYFGRRMHQKVTVIDSACCLVGGVNISNRYNDIGEIRAWLDWAVFAEGEIAGDLLKLSIRFWTRSPSEREKSITQNWRTSSIDEKCLVRARSNDWVRNKTQITRSYSEMIKNARSDITIMSSYFLPGALIHNKLVRAAKRKVRIQLILAEKSDILISKYAERYIYRRLLKNNIEIYEYQRSVVHGKMGTSDNKWVTVGSYNINNISAFASLELNLEIENEKFASIVQSRLDAIIQNDCVRITEESYRTKYHFFSRLAQGSAYYIIRIIFFLFTFYFRQKK